MTKFTVNTEGTYKHNMTANQMMFDLNNVHLTLINVNASSSQPTITSVWARRSHDAQRAEKITQGVNSSWNEDLVEEKDALFCIATISIFNVEK